MKKLRIMHIVHSINEGGIERRLLELCNKIDKTKFDIQVCCLIEKGNLLNEFEKLNIKVHLLNSKRNLSFKNIFINIYKLISLSILLRKEKIDITHGHEFYSTVFSRISSVLAHVKYRYITLHNMYYWWNPVIHKIQKYLSYVTTKVVCNSKSTLEYSLKYDKINKSKYTIIYTGINCDKFVKKNIIKQDIFNKYKILPGSFICMAVGNISPRKGFEYLIEAAYILKKEYDDMRYLIVGGKHHQETEEYDKLTKMIVDLGMDNSIFITGRSDNVSELLNYADLFLMPSIVEGLGLSLIEAMALEKIAVVSDIQPFKEIIDDNIDGYFFKSKNSESLARKIRDVRNIDVKCLESIKSNARKKILERFNSTNMVKEYEKLYSTNFV